LTPLCRFVLASTQELHEKISELAQRVRDLEDALRSSHSQLSGDQHPLLSDDLLRIKMPLQREMPASATSMTHEKDEPSPDVVDAFGSLSLGLSGRAKYYGHIANSWVSLLLPLTNRSKLTLWGQYFLQVSVTSKATPIEIVDSLRTKPEKKSRMTRGLSAFGVFCRPRF
jgi:hypothetical protein